LQFKNALEKYLKENPIPSLPAFPDIIPVKKKYTISSLPAVQNPDLLQEFYFDRSKEWSSDIIRRATHDLFNYQVKEGLTIPELQNAIQKGFCETPFVLDFVEYLKEAKNLRFGAVNNWIHEKCEDVPLPYKWEIKENTAIFYEWLAHFYAPNISWNRPNYSQVIYWND
jgi:hypothetical protein